MVAGLGFEPRQRESESLVLPLHHPAKISRYVSEIRGGVKAGVMIWAVLKSYQR